MVKTVSLFLRDPSAEVIMLPEGVSGLTVTAVADNRRLVKDEDYTIEYGEIELLIDPEPVLVQYQIGTDDE